MQFIKDPSLVLFIYLYNIIYSILYNYILILFMWDHPRVCATAQALTDEAQEARSRARLLACRGESGAWPQPYPRLAWDCEWMTKQSR